MLLLIFEYLINQFNYFFTFPEAACQCKKKVEIIMIMNV